jgi:PAS domain S-box-containing protein
MSQGGYTSEGYEAAAYSLMMLAPLESSCSACHRESNMSTDEVREKASLTSEDLAPVDAAIAVLGADHTVLSWNHRAESLTGYTLEALSGLDFIETFEPAKIMQQVLRRADAGEFPVNERLQLRTADDRHLPVEVQCAPLRSRGCSQTRMVLVIREVAAWQTWRPQDSRHLLLGQLAEAVSHEIRNPMNAIFLHADIVEEEVREQVPGDCTQIVQSLATIKLEVTRLHALIQDYLFLARLSDLHPAPVDLQALVENLVDEMHPQCVVRGVTLVLSGIDDLGEVALHQSLFRRALLNILQLLIEAMPQDATLTLGGDRTTSHVQLYIRDLGKVIPPEVWAALQVSLQAKMLEAADLRRYVAQEIITAHGGEIVVSDAAKEGMLYTITLPLDTTG